MKRNLLPYRLRKRWDEIISTEGVALGLSECRSIIENKMVNDIFYEGLFNGVPCIVKCSSKAPDSIANEYEMLKRVHEADSTVFPEPFSMWISRDGRMAFVVMEKIGGGTPAAPADDILRIAKTLRDTGIVHRDVSTENLLCGADGHLRLIDFQFAIDRHDYHESAFMRRNPKYMYVHFGSCEELGLGCWNDILGLGLIECLDRLAAEASDVRNKLIAMSKVMTFSISVPCVVRFRLRLYLAAIVFRMFFVRTPSLAWRRYKVGRLLSS